MIIDCQVPDELEVEFDCDYSKLVIRYPTDTTFLPHVTSVPRQLAEELKHRIIAEGSGAFGVEFENDAFVPV